MPMLRVLIGVILLGLGLAAQSPGAWAQAPDPDLNNDGIVNILDISLVNSCFGADLTGADHQVDRPASLARGR